MVERTLSIIKPDATRRNICGKIISVLEESNLRIIAQKRIRLTLELAQDFYNVHSNRPFYDELCEFMVSGSIVVQVLECYNAVDHYRTIMGATNPLHADPGTIRKEFAVSLTENSVHGSDSVDNAKKEIAFFFSETEIVG